MHFFSKLRYIIFPLKQVEPSKLSNNMKLLILIFDWDEKVLIILQVQIMKIEWKLYLEMKRQFSQVSILYRLVDFSRKWADLGTEPFQSFSTFIVLH